MNRKKLHLNVTYLAEADEEEEFIVNEAENRGVKWWTFEEALKVSTEPWMVENVYKKLIKKTGRLLFKSPGNTLGADAWSVSFLGRMQ